jgi:hypothetical protein
MIHKDFIMPRNNFHLTFSYILPSALDMVNAKQGGVTINKKRLETFPTVFINGFYTSNRSRLRLKFPAFTGGYACI